MYKGYGQWDTCTMGYMGNRVQGYGVQDIWGTWSMEYKGMGHTRSHVLLDP